MDLIVHSDSDTAANHVAEQIAGMIESTEDQFTLGLAGGNTPAATYRALRKSPIQWAKVGAWLSDERWVPHDHDRCNGRMAAEILMDHVEAEFHRPMWSEFLEPADSAARYEATIRSIHSDRRPDVVILGMGDDGHTASLFPGTTALDESSRWIVANYVPQHEEDRITATFPFLWSAKLLIVLAAGKSKAEALRGSFDGQTPAGRLGDGNAKVEWHVDEAAASLLS